MSRIAKKEDYNKKWDGILQKIKRAEGPHRNLLPNFIPKFEHLRNCLIASGMWKPKGWDDLIKTLNENESRDFLKGERPVSIGFDTNCFRNRIHSNLEREIKRYNTKFGFILSKVVQSELRPDKKINNRDVNFFKTILPKRSNFISEFWNQDTLEARRKSLGLREFNKIYKNATTKMNDRLKIRRDSKDIQIIKDLKQQAHEMNHDLIFITSDKQFLRHAREPGIMGIEVGIPPLDDMPLKFKFTWEQLCDFLYLLSIYEGIIGLNAVKGLHVLGIWRGKSIDEWDRGTIKIRLKNQQIAEAVKIQLGILNKLK